MEMFHSITGFLSDISGVITLLVFLSPFAMVRWRNYQDWRATRTRASIDAEIELLKKLQVSPSARIEYMLMRTMMVFMMAGCWLFMRTHMAIFEGTMPLSRMVDLIVGGTIYIFAAASIGQLTRLKKVEERLARLHERRSKLDVKLMGREEKVALLRVPEDCTGLKPDTGEPSSTNNRTRRAP